MKTASETHSAGTAGIPGVSATSRVAADELRDQIERLLGSQLHHVSEILQRHLTSENDHLSDVLDHASRFRGKQIRPVLLLLCERAISDQASPSGMTLAAVVEMIHMATLVHDDVIDDATMRRHLPTVNRQWNAETSVLLGDYLFSRSFRLAASTGDARACELIGQATDLTCAGELHQTAARLSGSQSERDYFRVIRGKTGQLFGLSCRMGARAAGAVDRMQRQLALAGLELGMAFQIADDLLDLTGEQQITGKDACNDLANQRLTLPLLRSLQLATQDEASEMLRALDRAKGARIIFDELPTSSSAPGSSDSRLNSVLKRGVMSAQQTAEHLADRCIARFERLPASDARELLKDIARYSVRRQH